MINKGKNYCGLYFVQDGKIYRRNGGDLWALKSGETDFLKQKITCFIRLGESRPGIHQANCFDIYCTSFGSISLKNCPLYQGKKCLTLQKKDNG